VFEDSPTCINFQHDHAPRHPCGECPLIDLVPHDRRNRQFPCRHIDLTESGDTVHSFYEYGTEEELESALANWLRETIRQREADESSRIQAA